jgi:hypothetical protein
VDFLTQEDRIKGADILSAAYWRHPCRLELRSVDMWKPALAGRTRLKGVGKPVDGQKDARPPACLPRAAFPHTHRRNSRFKEKSPRARTKSDESNIPVGRFFLAAPGPLYIHIRTASKNIFPDRKLHLTLLPYMVLFLPNMVTIRKAHRE